MEDIIFILDIPMSHIKVLHGGDIEQAKQIALEMLNDEDRPKTALPPMILRKESVQAMIVNLLKAYAEALGEKGLHEMFDPYLDFSGEEDYEPEDVTYVQGNKTIQ